MLAAVADQRDLDVAQGIPAVGAALQPVPHRLRLGHIARVPVSALDRPRHEVLQAAEHRAALARPLEQTEPVVALDASPAPGAALPLAGCRSPARHGYRLG